ncbi:MAG: peptidase, partial [Caulobacter sp.]|nr:peptidase [Caulobacter sp.]
VFLALGLALSILAPQGALTQAQAQIPYLQLPAAEPRYAAIVLDANTGEVMYAKRSDSPRYPASITKIMTLYLAFEALSEGRLRPDDLITVSSHAAAQAPTKLGLSAGDQITVDDAMRAIAVKSANDMAVALAEKLGGSESRFAALMTLRAQELGMSETRFVNASGLPDSRQISTARDIATLSRAVMRDFPQYYSFFNIRSFTYRGVSMNNHNGLLGRFPGVDGLKTGYTTASGFNLAASAVRDGRRLIVVVMGGSSSGARDANVQSLLLTGFDIMDRRSRGERITVAQNLFEPQAPAAPPPSQYAQANYGSSPNYGSSQGSEIQLTSNPTAPQVNIARMSPIPDRPSAPVRTYASMDQARQAPAPVKAAPPKVVVAKAPPKVVAPPKGEWAVQVGAFRGRSQARAQVDLIDRRFGNMFAQAEGFVEDAVQGQFRARFGGMTASEAQKACRTLAAQNQVCQVIAPGH